MKPQISLVLVCMLLSEAFQAATALRCYKCVSSGCQAADCNENENRCYTGEGSFFGYTLTGKGCANSEQCKALEDAGKAKCCQTDLCNGAEGVKLSLLIMLVPLISSFLFS